MGSTPKNYNRLFLGLLQHFHTADGPTPEDVEAYLLKGEGDSVRWPTDDEFESAWYSVPAYQRLRRDRTRMVLEAIDRALITNRQEGLPLPDSLTIEHVLPQSAEPRDWPFPDEFKVQGIDSFEGLTATSTTSANACSIPSGTSRSLRRG